MYPPDDREQADWKIADAAIDALERAPKDNPFFVGCGFRLPHVPCYASQKWFNLYPEDTLELPPVKLGLTGNELLANRHCGSAADGVTADGLKLLAGICGLPVVRPGVDGRICPGIPP